jgi:hypothetical protein
VITLSADCLSMRTVGTILLAVKRCSSEPGADGCPGQP